MIGQSELILAVPTVLIQMSIGAMACLFLTKLSSAELFATAEGKALESRVVFGSLVLSAGGMIAATTHLAYPLGSWLMPISQLSTSWLSRESLFYLLFIVALVVYAIKLFSGKPVGSGLAMFASVVGLLAVLSGAMIYAVIGGVPSWNNAFTVLLFLMTFLLLGSAMFGLVLSMGLGSIQNDTVKNMAKDAFKSRVLVLLPLLILSLIVTIAYLAFVGSKGEAGSASFQMMIGSSLFWVRLIVGFVAPLLLVMALKGAFVKGSYGTVFPYTVGVFVLILVGEILGRVIFYSTSVSVAMGGGGTPY
jgi:anaerobic dimethyl sulfoxide reductase subunit C (anchor subunit)